MRDQNETGIYVIFWPPMKSSTITRDRQRDEKQSRAQWHVNSINMHDRSRVRFSHSPDFSPFTTQFTKPRIGLSRLRDLGWPTGRARWRDRPAGRSGSSSRSWSSRDSSAGCLCVSWRHRDLGSTRDPTIGSIRRGACRTPRSCVHSDCCHFASRRIAVTKSARDTVKGNVRIFSVCSENIAC